MCGKCLVQCLVPTWASGKASSFPEEGCVIPDQGIFILAGARTLKPLGLPIVETLIENLENVMEEKKQVGRMEVAGLEVES